MSTGTRHAVMAIAAAVIFIVWVLGLRQLVISSRDTGAAQCTTSTALQAVSATAGAASQVASQANADITRGSQAATANERAQTRIVTLYRTLESEARHVPSGPDLDACVLPAERLRLWTAANAGPSSAPDPAHQSAAASQPDNAASDAAATDLGPSARPGAEPPPGGSGLSPTGGALLRAASDPGDRAP